MDLSKLIRDVPDFPKKGIVFKDITTLCKDAVGFKETIDIFYNRYKDKGIDKVAGIESRGFIFGAALADRLNCGLILIRKPGKLPAETVSEEYTLEYGTDKIEIHKDAIDEGETILLIDDLLATGGTAAAAVNLIKKVGGNIEEIAFLIELTFLNGADKLDVPYFSIIPV